jgi:transcriptional regulator with XRE-family HTH domain
VTAKAQFGAALKRRRLEKRMTQEELAFRADLSVVYVRGLENGRFNPTLNVLFDIGRALDAHPSTLLADVPLDAETQAVGRKRPGPPEGTLRGPKS